MKVGSLPPTVKIAVVSGYECAPDFRMASGFCAFERPQPEPHHEHHAEPDDHDPDQRETDHRHRLLRRRGIGGRHRDARHEQRPGAVGLGRDAVAAESAEIRRLAGARCEVRRRQLVEHDRRQGRRVTVAEVGRVHDRAVLDQGDHRAGPVARVVGEGLLRMRVDVPHTVGGLEVAVAVLLHREAERRDRTAQLRVDHTRDGGVHAQDAPDADRGENTGRHRGDAHHQARTQRPPASRPAHSAGLST